jgi:hypothetical protein
MYGVPCGLTTITEVPGLTSTSSRRTSASPGTSGGGSLEVQPAGDGLAQGTEGSGGEASVPALPLDDESVRGMVYDASAAPSLHNAQPWHFR